MIDRRIPAIRRAVSFMRGVIGDHLYERRFGVQTSGLVMLDFHDEENICYVAVNWRHLRPALPVASVTQHDVFIDLGSGMGRAVLEAAVQYPFSRVVGVELSPDLHAIARRNMAGTKLRLRCPNVELVLADLRDFPIPDDVTVVFMNNPVRGSIFASVLGELAASWRRRPRRIRLVYSNPAEDAAVMATGMWSRILTISTRRTQWPFGATRVYESAGGAA